MATKKSSTGRKKTTSRKKSAKSSGKKPIRREVGAIVCFFLALLGIASYFGGDAPFISYFRVLFAGLAGWGYYLYPPVLLFCSFILLFHRGRPVVWRVTSAMLFPLALSILLFVTFNKNVYITGWNLFPDLFKEGAALGNAGVVSGLISLGVKALVGRAISAIIFGVLMIFFALSALNVTVNSIIEAVRSREHLEYEVQPEPERKPRPRKNKVIDLPVDDPEDIKKAQAKETDYFADIPLDTTVSAGKNKESKIPFVFGEPAEIAVKEKTPAARPTELVKPEPAVDNREVTVPPELTAAEKRAEVNKAAAEVTQAIESEGTQDKPAYVTPPLSILEAGDSGSAGGSTVELKLTAKRLSDTLRSFDIEARIVDFAHGPSVTRYELELEQGVKLSKLSNLSDDIALALGTASVRIAPVPGKSFIVGVEVPNKSVSMVHLREVLSSKEFTTHKSKLAFALGRDIGGNSMVGDIAKLPHLLIAGTTGSGKSVCMNSLIISLLYKASPDEVRLIMVDPKMVELGGYNEIPHLLIPVVTDAKKAAGALQWAVNEMMRRYSIFAESGAKDMDGYNAAVRDNPERKQLYRIVIVIDELADLMMVAKKEVEEYICRIAQMGRAAGMHLVVATQRPSADIITGVMKANIPSRIAFAVASQMESRIILDTAGAEKLLGKGDMLYLPIGASKATRIQGTMVTDEEVEGVVEFVKNSSKANYSDEIIKQVENHGKAGEGKSDSAPGADSDADELLPDAIEVVVETGQASVSMLQRRLKLGYSRAARIVDQMEERGIVGPFEGSKPRQLLITKEQWAALKMKGTVSADALEEEPQEIIEEE